MTAAFSTSGQADSGWLLHRYTSALVRRAVTVCRHSPERRAPSSQRSTAVSASDPLPNTTANLAMLEYASTAARGESSASSGARVARKHLTDESKQARS